MARFIYNNFIPNNVGTEFSLFSYINFQLFKTFSGSDFELSNSLLVFVSLTFYFHLIMFFFFSGWGWRSQKAKDRKWCQWCQRKGSCWPYRGKWRRWWCRGRGRYRRRGWREPRRRRGGRRRRRRRPRWGWRWRGRGWWR